MCLGPSEVTFCSGICSSVILAPGRYTFALAFALSVSWPQGGNLLLWHLLERWLGPREVTFCSGTCSSGGLASGREPFGLELGRGGAWDHRRNIWGWRVFGGWFVLMSETCEYGAMCCAG